MAKPLLWDKLCKKRFTGNRSVPKQMYITPSCWSPCYTREKWSWNKCHMRKEEHFTQIAYTKYTKKCKKKKIGHETKAPDKFDSPQTELPKAVLESECATIHYSIKHYLSDLPLRDLYNSICSWKAVVKVHCMRSETQRSLWLTGHCEQQDILGWVLL